MNPMAANSSSGLSSSTQEAELPHLPPAGPGLAAVQPVLLRRVRIQIAVAILLILWAMAETYQVIFHPIMDAGLSAPEWVPVLVIELKLLLSAWLTLAFRSQVCRVATILLLFAIAVSCAGRAIGHLSLCAWTTALPFGLWESFVGATLTLFPLVPLARAVYQIPSPEFPAVMPGPRRCVAAFGLTMVALVAVTAVAGQLAFGSITTAFAYIRGEPFSLSPATAVLRQLSSGERRTVRFTLTNLGHEPLRIVGGGSSCSCCNATGDLPVTVAPASSVDLEVEVFLGEVPPAMRDTPLEQAVVFFTDSRTAPAAYARIVGYFIR